MPGLTAPKITGKMSLRASITGSIVMEDVRVPAANMLPNVKGLKVGLLERPYTHTMGTPLMRHYDRAHV